MIKISQAIRIAGDDMVKLAVLDGCDMELQTDGTPGDVMINRINVPAEHRGKGYGRTMLKAACDVADLTGVTLWILPVPYVDCPMTKDELVAWYHRNGFVEFGGILRRSPS